MSGKTLIVVLALVATACAGCAAGNLASPLITVAPATPVPPAVMMATRLTMVARRTVAPSPTATAAATAEPSATAVPTAAAAATDRPTASAASPGQADATSTAAPKEMAARPAPAAPLVVTPVITQPVTATQIITYTPPVPRGAIQVGRCWTNSLAVWRVGAWRCMVGHSIYDPCFAKAGSQTVICGGNPLAGRSTFTLRLSEPLPKTTPMPASPDTANHAWVLLLADGTTCTYATGATGGVDGKRVNYLCSGTDLATGSFVVVLGDPQMGTVWQVEKARVASRQQGVVATEVATVPVRTVWR